MLKPRPEKKAEEPAAAKEQPKPVEVVKAPEPKPVEVVLKYQSQLLPR